MKRPSWRTLQAENQRLRQENATLKARLAKLQTRVARLEQMLADSQRAGKRQAAPFSKGPPTAKPKQPGRKGGAAYGVKAHRAPPRPEEIDEVCDAPLPEACPHCGGSVQETHVAQQYQTEIPRRLIHRQFQVHIGRCRACGQRVQGRHDLQTSDALGAAAAQLGPNLQASIVFLNKRCGLSHGKIVQFFQEQFGLSLSRGGSVQALLRAGRRCQPLYQQIVHSVRASPWAVPDETGWKVGGRPGWLHALVGREATCFVISPRRSAEAAASVLGWDYEGTLIHDGFSSYDRFENAWHQQCARHLLRRARELREAAQGAAARFPQQVLELFAAALAARDRRTRGELSEDDAADWYLGLTAELEELTRRRKRNPANETLSKHLKKHRWEWFWFLLDPQIDATNYRAEQAVRVGVVNRKVWGGNRTWAGASAQETLMSVLATCQRHLHNSIDYLSRLLCGLPPPLLPAES